MSFTGKQAAEVLREQTRIGMGLMANTLRTNLIQHAPERIVNLAIMMASKCAAEVMPKVDEVLQQLEAETISFEVAVEKMLDLSAKSSMEMAQRVVEVLSNAMIGQPNLRSVKKD